MVSITVLIEVAVNMMYSSLSQKKFSQPKPQKCLGCRHKIQRNQRFCPHCGMQQERRKSAVSLLQLFTLISLLTGLILVFAA